jgi:hypothetical protein
VGYLRTREPLLRRQWWLAVASVLLMIPVLLDVTSVISLGQWRIAPFIILLIVSLAISGPRNDATKP